MTVRVGINGFGRIGRNFYRALRPSRPRASTDIEVVAVNDITDNSTLAHLLKFDSILGRLPRRDRLEGEDTIVVGSAKIKALEVREGPAALPWGDLASTWSSNPPECSPTPRQGQGPPGRRRQEGDHLRAGHRRGHHHRAGRQRRQVRRQPEHHLQRVVHHELPWAAGQGAQRRVRHRQGPDDDHPRLHPGPEPAGRAAQGPAPRPGRRAEHRADLDRRGQGHRPGAARAQGQARRVRAAGADPHRLGDRPDRRAGQVGHRRGDQRRDEGRRRRPDEGHPEVLRRADRRPATSSPTRTARSSTPA